MSCENSPNFKHGRSRTKEYDNELHLKRNYGLSIEQFNIILLSQNNKCARCGSPAPDHHKKRLNVDHCHETGKIRGILCDACNRALGLFKDDPEILNKAIDYLHHSNNSI